MADTTRQDFADLIDQFNKAWVRPEKWNENELDETSVRIRELWGFERDKWTINLLDLIRTWLLWPDDSAGRPAEEALPSWTKNIATFRDNMILGAETVEMQVVEGLEGNDGA